MNVLKTLHAATSLLLMVVFFAFALALAVALIIGGGFIGYTLVTQARFGRGVIVVGLISVAFIAAGLIILWSLVPRINRFEPPGPELLPDQHPDLFREIARTAAMAGEAPPKQVFLVPDVNAFVTERGGVMGIGSQRVMGIGLPLLHVLTVSELRAVLAHELGHFVGGDTKLGPWVGKTRVAMARTLENFAGAANATQGAGELSMVFYLLHLPFKGFFTFYMRFTQALSRSQEYAADALAVRIEGAEAMSSALRKTEHAHVGYSLYLRHEVAPILARGLVPPIGLGFSRYLKAEKIAAALKEVLSAPADDRRADPFDSHPPTAQRIEAIAALPNRQLTVDARPALGLLTPAALRGLEQALSARLSPDGTPLELVEWDQSHRALALEWLEAAKEWIPHMGEVTFATLDVSLQTSRVVLSRSLGLKAVGDVKVEDIHGWARGIYSQLMFLALMRAGFVPSNSPGAPLLFSRGDVSIEPALIMRARLDGETDDAKWRETVESLGIADVKLASLSEH